MARKKNDNRALIASHIFRDPGPPIAEADYQPRTVQRDPQEFLAAIFREMGADYGGKLARVDALDELARRLVTAS
jgi:hypothetical protein